MNRSGWAKIHTHIHTMHSDGGSSLLEMAKAHRDKGFDAFFVTDHNTSSAMGEAGEVFEKTGITVLPGVEYTTFHGHMLSYGSYVGDWTQLNPKSLKNFLGEMGEKGAISGIAHYYCAGYPLCTGCRFEFDGAGTDHAVLDPFNTMEVWHVDRINWVENARLWTELLNRGNRISALAGLDAHSSGEVLASPLANYVRLSGEGTLEDKIFRSMKKGDLFLSRGGLTDFTLKSEGRAYTMGDSVPVGEEDAVLEISCRLELPSLEYVAGGPRYFRVVTNRGAVQTEPFFIGDTDSQGDFTMELPRRAWCSPGEEPLKWLRVEMVREDEFTRRVQTMTNPLYFI